MWEGRSAQRGRGKERVAVELSRRDYSIKRASPPPTPTGPEVQISFWHHISGLLFPYAAQINHLFITKYARSASFKSVGPKGNMFSAWKTETTYRHPLHIQSLNSPRIRTLTAKFHGTNVQQAQGIFSPDYGQTRCNFFIVVKLFLPGLQPLSCFPFTCYCPALQSYPYRCLVAP